MTRWVVAVLVVMISFAQSSAAQQLRGEGTWESLSSDVIQGTWEASLIQTGNRLEGTFALKGSNVLTGGAVSGDLTESQIALGIAAQGTRSAQFSGKVTGESIAGEWTSDVAGDHGVWYGRLTKAKSVPLEGSEEDSSAP